MATALPGPSGRGNPGLGFIGRRITMGNGKLTVTSSGFGRGRSAVPAAAIGNLEHMGIDDVDNYLGDQVNDRNNGNYGNPLNWDFLETEIEIENPEDEPGLPNSHEITDALEEKYVRNRLDIVKEDGFIVTPLNALRKMAKENATNLHFEYNEIKIGPYKLYLVELFCGAMKGKGESIRRKVAAQMAAADILNELKRRGIPIPVYGLVPGFRLNPLIFGELINLCDQLEFDHPMFVQMPVDPEAENPPLYSYKCQIGQLVLLGSSDNCCVAKRWAAYNMFNALTGYDIPLDRVCMGKDCSAMQRYGLKYQYSEKKAEAMAARQALISASKTEIIEAGGIPALNTDNAADSDAEEELDTALIEGTRGLCLNSDQITEIRDRVALLNLEELDQEVLDEILGEVPVVGEVAGEVVAEVGGKEDDDADSMDWNEEIIFDSTDDEGLGE